MLTKLRAKLCCSQADGDTDDAEPAIPHAKRSNDGGNTTSAKRNSSEAASIPPDHTAASPKDLWQVAFDSLDPKHKHWLSKEEKSPIEIIRDVIGETKSKYTEYKKKELTIRRHNGGEIKVREIAQNILASALNAQQVITAVASFDPSGYASSAWTIVSLGLTMTQRVIARRDVIIEASEYLAEQLAYFTVLDSDRRYTKASVDKQLDGALVGVYTAILEYTAEVRKTYHESGFARIGSTLIPLTEQPLQKLRTAVENKTTMTEKWATISDRSYLRGQAADILAAIDKTIEELQNIHSTVLSVEDRGILEWLSQYDFSKAQNDTQYHKLPGTGDWLLKSKEYVEWKGYPGSILWLHGVAGCGKSVICSTIIEDIQRSCLDGSNKRFAYWYFQFNEPSSQRVEDMLRTIIRQLHSTPLDEPIRRLWNDYGTKGGNPNIAKLQDTLEKLLSANIGKVFLILDALDECPEAVNRKERSLLLPLLTGLQNRYSDKLHILVTSRPEPDIFEHLVDCPGLDIEENQGSDISAFVKDRVEALDDRRAPKEVKTQIYQELLQDKKRRFRWADLQVKRLEECRNKSQIIEALSTMPQTLHDIYLSVIERINAKPSDVIYAKTILTWLCFSVRPLTLTEVAAAAGLEVPEDVIKICTTSFVTFRHSDDEIRLAHFSVREFLVSNECTGQWHQLSTLNGHVMLAEHSLRLLLQMPSSLSREEVDQEELLDYAACNWQEHFQASAITPNPAHENLQEMVDMLFRQSAAYRNWRYISTYFDEQEVQATPIGAASDLGLIQIVTGLLEDGANPLEWFAIRRGYYHVLRNAYLVASESGHLEILSLLLRKVCVSIDLAEGIMEIVQCHGFESQKLEDVFDTLSASGAIFNRTENKGLHIDERIVVAAARNIVCGTKLVTILLDRYEETGAAFVPVTENVLKTVLQNMECGDDILQLLLQRRNGDVRIYSRVKEMLEFPVNLNKRAIAILLAQRQAEIVIDEQLIAHFARYTDDTGMKILSSVLDNDSMLTENVLASAVQNRSGVGVLRQILRHRRHWPPVSEDLLCEAACNGDSEKLEALLDDCGLDFAMSERVMLEIVGNRYYGAEMLEMLLRRQQAGFIVTPAILDTAASHKRAKHVVELLMNNGGLKIPITEGMMLRISRDDLLCYLLDLEERSQIHPLPITEKFILHAVKTFESTTLKAIFRSRPKIYVSEDMFVESCRGGMFVESCHGGMSTLTVLMEQPHSQLPVTRMIEALEKEDGQRPTNILQLLLNGKSFEVDHGIIERFAHNASALSLLLQTTPHVPITEQAAIRAASGHALWVLLDERIESFPISEEVMSAVVRSFHPFTDLRRILAHHGPQVPITGKVLVAASGTLEALQLLLQALGPEAPHMITEEVVAMATYKSLSALPRLLEKYGSAVPLTERVMVFAAANGLNGLQCLLREWPGNIDLNRIWRAIWKFDRDSCDFSYGRDWPSLVHIQKNAGSHVVQFSKAVDLSEDVFMGALASSALDESIGRYSGLIPLIDVCIEHDLSVPEAEGLVRAVLDKCDSDLMEAIRELVEKYEADDKLPKGKFGDLLLSRIRERESHEISAPEP
ncbi:hypothetical protein BO83DRAFT_435227 [Aspergillus eucalypticola CBS 122712]|uniref:NACHT domain-containing protein n=1 Tax=Aspergillus eucalypticola (strain CBS 122712 / IBT 29274) TaxID=1448314 RepID=A0A317W2S8_ASPEC|nr:uncharacterized protein BO83DRAFT_435227 [Aspergillus eucalypticola CBS 122712]PWY80209.1 hypothetical protein BO83DRAFT_435227 [Aspergillus eucalypticola CBS 122712]